MATSAQVLAARERARLAARALLTAQLNGLAGPGFVAEACWSSPADAIQELADVTLSAVRWAAIAHEVDPVDVLAALLTGRTAVECEQATEG
jgi:hypothetical protein